MGFGGNLARTTKVFVAAGVDSGKVTTPLEVPPNFNIPMCQDSDIFLAHPTVQIVWLIGGVCRSCPHLTIHFFMGIVFLDRIVGRFAGVRLISCCLISLGSLFSLA